MKQLKSLLIILALLVAPLKAETLQEWTMEENYSGPYSNSFNKLRYEVPILMRQTMIDLSVRCGLDFQEGWRMPMIVRFVDGSPMGVENVLAYVQMGRYSDGSYAQSLNINLAAYDKEHFNFDKVFAHELVHAMLNDSMGGESNSLPTWFHEGLAVYGAGQGDQMTAAYVARYPTVNASYFINGLEGPHGALDYAEDYLAFKYIHDRHGVTSLQNLIKEVIKRKGDIPGALEYTCFENWDEFKDNARKFSEDEISRLDRQSGSRSNENKAY